MHACVYACLFVCVCMFVYVCTLMCVHFVCVCVHVHACVCAWLCVCVCFGKLVSISYRLACKYLDCSYICKTVNVIDQSINPVLICSIKKKF